MSFDVTVFSAGVIVGIGIMAIFLEIMTRLFKKKGKIQ
jgi:hypothetical protein